MKSGRATMTIVAYALRRQGARAALIAACVLTVSAAWLRGGPPLFPVWASLCAALAGAGIAADTLSVDPQTRRLLLCAPLYGRELARALIVAPALFALAAGAALAALAAPGADPGLRIALLCGPLCAVFIGVSATLRTGKERAFFIGGALLAGFGAAFIGTLGTIATTAASVALTAVIGYFGLRAFGETFARLDAID